MNFGKLQIFTLLGLFLIITSPLGWTGDIQSEVTLSPNDLVIKESAGFDLPFILDSEYTREVGAPALPIVRAHVAIPTDATVVQVRMLQVDTHELEGQYNVLPNMKPLRGVDMPGSGAFYQDPAFYGSNSDYPGYYTSVASTWDRAGQDFVTLNLYPVQYNPVTGKITMATRIAFEVEYEEAEEPVRETYNFSPTTRASMQKKIRSMAVNPQDVADLPSYAGSSMRTLDPGNYEYVIITSTIFASYFQPLADWRTKLGMPAKIVTTDYIYTNFPGTTNQVKIKRFVEEAHVTWGCLFFLLGGDANVVPCHYRAVGGDSVPNDAYYADYDFDWVIDVYVGRASVNNYAQVVAFMNKIFTYEKTPPDGYGRKVFFMGFDADATTHDEDNKILIASNYLSPTANFVSEYDSEPGGHETDCKTYLNGGQNLVNHADHGYIDNIGVGSTNHGTYFSISEATKFSNGLKYTNMVTISCLSAQFTSMCWGEYFVRDDQGGITYTGNTMYGWYDKGNPYSLSGKYDLRWWKMLYEGHYQIGETLGEAKNSYPPNDELTKYIFAEWTLLGDPALMLWDKNPVDLTVTHDAAINTGSQSFSVHVDGSGAYLEGALVCLMKGTEVYDYTTTNILGNAAFTINPLTAGNLDVTVTAHNFKCYEGVVPVTSSGPPPTVSGLSPRCGMEAGGAVITVTGTNFTTTPAMTVEVNDVACTSVNVVNATTLTCQVPAGTNGWYDVDVVNTYGSDTFTDGFRYFPVGLNGSSQPFNGTDVKTDALNTPTDVNLIFAGLPSKSFGVFYSLGGGPIYAGIDVIGLDIPFYLMYIGKLNAQGYFLFPVTFPSGYGPIDFYIHAPGQDAMDNVRWPWGGSNPNGSGSIWIHLNN